MAGACPGDATGLLARAPWRLASSHLLAKCLPRAEKCVQRGPASFLDPKRQGSSARGVVLARWGGMGNGAQLQKDVLRVALRPVCFGGLRRVLKSEAVVVPKQVVDSEETCDLAQIRQRKRMRMGVAETPIKVTQKVPQAVYSGAGETIRWWRL